VHRRATSTDLARTTGGIVARSFLKGASDLRILPDVAGHLLEKHPLCRLFGGGEGHGCLFRHPEASEDAAQRYRYPRDLIVMPVTAVEFESSPALTQREAVVATMTGCVDPVAESDRLAVWSSMVRATWEPNRIDRLEERGLVERDTSPDDRRKVIVRLTRAGLGLVDEIVVGHMGIESEILSALSPRQQRELARYLRQVLLSLGDSPMDAND
jgi:hypothetical protein